MFAVAGKEAAIVKLARSVNVRIERKRRTACPIRNRAASGTTGNRGLWSGRYVLWSDVGACGYRPLILEQGAGCGQPCKGSCTLLDRWNAGSGVQCAVRRGECQYVFRWKLNTLVKDPSGRNKGSAENLGAGRRGSDDYLCEQAARWDWMFCGRGKEYSK